MSKYMRSLWSNTGDISIRDEVSDTLHGNDFQLPRGRWGILRRLRRDENHQFIDCPQCKKRGVHAPSTNTFCDVCFGEGYTWDEEWVIYYKWSGALRESNRHGYKDYGEAGYVENKTAVAYLEYNTHPSMGDKLIEVVSDQEGKIVDPYIRKTIWDIRFLDELILDNGRNEYWRLSIALHQNRAFGQPMNLLERTKGSIP